MPPPVVDTLPGHQLAPGRRREIIDLCESVFAEDLSALFEVLGASVHLTVRDRGVLVAHACWVERWLEAEGSPLLRTAFVKAVAVAPERQGQGWGTLAMRRAAGAIATYDLGALVTREPSFYTWLGWEAWRGPTAIRLADGLLPSPDARPLILRMAHTPPLDLDAPLTIEWRVGELW
jgi:GNAT superfamily N-acetyltransferase